MPALPTSPRPAYALIERVLPVLALLVIICFLTPTSPDADLWGHLTFGRDIVHTGKVHSTDPYSFTSDRPWINHEWLAEAIMWLAYAAGGAAGLVALKLVLASVAGGALLATWRPHRLCPAWRDGLLFATALATWPVLVTIRPQVFSVTMFALLLTAMDRIRGGAVRWMIALPLLFGIWVNLHGGWIVGAGALVIFVACSWFDRRWSTRDRALLLLAACASALATLCNPYGVSMLAFLAETVRPERSDILEWRTVNQVPLTVLALWMVPTAIATAAAIRGKLRREPLVIVALLAIGSFRVVRLLGFYALAVGFFAAPSVRAGDTVQEDNRNAHEHGGVLWARRVAAVLALVAVAVTCFGRTLAMDGSWLPDRESTLFIRSHALHGRLLTWFDYGEFAIWHFSPAIRVSIDGRRETVYSDATRRRQARIFSDEPGALDEVAQLAPDYVWLPANFAVVTRLEAVGWRAVFRGSRSVVLSKEPLRESLARYEPQWGPRIFPGP